MVRLNRHSCLFLLLAVLYFGTPSHSVAEIKLVTGEYLPYTSQNADGGGITTKLVKSIFKTINSATTIEFRPWGRGYAETTKGVYAATFPYLKTEDRQKEFYYSDPIVHWKSNIYIMNGSILTEKDLIGRIECLPFHYAAIGSVEKLFQAGKIKRERPAKIENCWNMLLRNRVHFFVEDQQVAREFIDTHLYNDRDKIGKISTPVKSDFGYVIFPKNRPGSLQLLEKFNAELRNRQAEQKPS